MCINQAQWGVWRRRKGERCNKFHEENQATEVLCIYIHIYTYMFIYMSKNAIFHVHVHHATSHDGPFIQYPSEVTDCFTSAWQISVLKRLKLRICDICATRRCLKSSHNTSPSWVFVGCQIHEICKPLTPAES